MSRRRPQLLVIQTSDGMLAFQSVQLWTTSSEFADGATHLTLASLFAHLQGLTRSPLHVCKRPLQVSFACVKN